MDTIRTFLDNLFDTLPNRPDVMKAKDDLFDMMVQKYQDYKNEGKSEHEALGLVISEFGDISELLDELGIKASDDHVTMIDRDQATAIIKTYHDNVKKVAWGVFMIIFGMAMVVMLEGIVFQHEAARRFDVLRSLPFIVLLVPAIGLFISAGMAMGAKTKDLEVDFHLASDAKATIKASSDLYEPIYRNGILWGVMTIIGSSIFFVIAALFTEFGTYLVAFGMIVIAAAIWLLIRRGVIMGIHNRLLKKGDHSPAMKRAEKITDLVAGIVFPLTVIVYLLISFLTGRWGITWIIWPIVGILFGIFAGTVEAIQKNKK